MSLAKWKEKFYYENGFNIRSEQSDETNPKDGIIWRHKKGTLISDWLENTRRWGKKEERTKFKTQYERSRKYDTC